MSDVVSIELTFDADLEAAVRAEWEALRAAELSSLAAHTSESNRPHVTLLARTGLLDLAGLEGSGLDGGGLDAGAVLPLPITLGAPMLFGAGPRRVLVRSVVPTIELLSLHAAVHRAARGGADVPHTRPGGWLPHVTLARRLKLDDVAGALARTVPALGDELRGTATVLRRWDAASATITTLAGA